MRRRLDTCCRTCDAHVGEPCRYTWFKRRRGVNEGKTHYSPNRFPHLVGRL